MAALLAFVLLSSPAPGQSSEPPHLEARVDDSTPPKQVPLAFDGDPGCNDQRRFLDSFHERLDTVRLLPDEQGALVQVTITSSGEGFEASLSILLADGETLRRTLRANTCEEAVDVIAFVASVALDPASRDPIKLRERKPEPDPEPEEPPPSEPKPVSPRFSLGLQGMGLLAVAPDPMIGGQLFAGLSQMAPGWWSPSARVALSSAIRNGRVTEGGTADFSLMQAGVHLCPSRAMLGIFLVRPCVTTSGGVIRAEGRETYDARSVNRPWIASGAALLMGLDIHPHLNLIADVEAGFPWIADDFLFEGTIFHSSPTVFGKASIGIEVLFGDR